VHPDAAARADGRREPAPPDVAIAARHDPRALQLLRADVIGHGTVPSAPEVLLEILQLLEDDAGDMRRLFGAVERDPGLTAKVLRTANGSFFGQSRTVDSIERATLVLGVAMVRSLAISAAVFDRVGSALPGPFVDRIWRHSLATATVARALASRVAADRDAAFTAGLLHDAGMMLLLRRHPDLYRGRDVDAPTEDLERAAVGVDHGVVAGWLFDAWRLPAVLVEAIAQHHADVPSQGLGAVVWAASVIAHDPDAALLAGGDAPRADAARAAAAAFGLTADSWTAIAAGPRRGGRS
jgi:putative nucleotidyltransferase with HDIG domain